MAKLLLAGILLGALFWRLVQVVKDPEHQEPKPGPSSRPTIGGGPDVDASNYGTGLGHD